MQTERDSTASVDEENASEEGLLREYRAEISRLQGELNLAREKRESGKLLNHQDKAKGPSYVPEEMVAEWEKRYPFILVTDFFQLGKLKSSIYAEVFSGIIQFISCLYCLPVIPEQLKYAGYNEERGTVVISLACMLGCLLLGCWTNLPFCVAPPTAVSIYFSVAVQDRNLKASEGSTAVMLSGILLLFFIHKPFLRFSVRLIPNCVQVRPVACTYIYIYILYIYIYYIYIKHLLSFFLSSVPCSTCTD
jgi:hypothetical protein